MMTCNIIDGMLMLFHHPLSENAATIREHVESFERHSRFRVWTVNTELGFPPFLKQLRFSVVVLHYSLFGAVPYEIGDEFLEYLEQCDQSYKVAFFQDEMHFCRARFNIVNHLGIQTIFSLMEPKYYSQFYGKYTSVSNVVFCLTGYVSENLLVMARRYTRPFANRRIYVGYRARQLPFHLGQGGQEKYTIAVQFRQLTRGRNMVLDVETNENKRIYGRSWYEFLGNCRAVLGVEAGSSLVDVEDMVRPACDMYLRRFPAATFDEVYERILAPWDGNISYRTSSPRHFEAAALRVVQVLFEGVYSGVLVPDRHYIPLKKDFSNLEQVLALLADDDHCRNVAENAFQDLIASGLYDYSRFIASFDEYLLTEGLQLSRRVPGEDLGISPLLEQSSLMRKARATAKAVLNRPFRGRSALGRIIGHLRPPN